jgi:outer membrane receptor for ferrienterochelin and colicin
LEGFSVGGNLTVIKSEVTIANEDVDYYYHDRETHDYLKYGFIETSRDMLNAPEYLYNLNATYDIAKTGTKLGLFYTVRGDTLVAGPNNRGDDYTKSVYAKEYGTLNFSLSQKIGKQWTLGFKAKNLLNPEIQEVSRSEHIAEGDTLRKSYTKGMEFSVSLGCEF